MSTNTGVYKDNLHHLPVKERKAAEEALFLEDGDEKETGKGITEPLIEQLNRRKQGPGLKSWGMAAQEKT